MPATRSNVPHPYIVVGNEGLISIGDGTHEVGYNSVAAFQVDEPRFTMPDVAQLNYEQHHSRTFLMVRERGGKPVHLDVADYPEYATYVTKVAVYQAAIDARQPPPYVVPELADSPDTINTVAELCADVNEMKAIMRAAGIATEPS